MTNEHGNCPNCKADLNGGSIWRTGYDLAMAGRHYEQEGVPSSNAEEAGVRADKYAALYGATRTKGRWGRQIGHTRNDRIAEWECPDCGHKWPR